MKIPLLYALFVGIGDLYLIGFSFSELITIFFLAYIILLAKKKYVLSRPSILWGGFLLLIVILFFYVRSRAYFLPSSFLNNFIRLCYYSLGMMLIPKYLVRNNRLSILIRGLGQIIMFLASLAFIEFVFRFIFGINWDWGFLNIFRPYGQDYILMRVRALYSEPAHFGISLGVMLLVYIHHHLDKRKSQLYYIVISCGIFGLLSTISMISYVLLTLNLVLVFIGISKDGNITKAIKSRIRISLMSTLAVLLIILGLTGVLKEKFTDRLSDIFGGTDTSTQHRIAGQFEIVSVTFQNYPYTGIGLGQNLAYLQSRDWSLQNFFFKQGYSKQSGINNIFAYVLLQTGLIGLILFVAFFINTFWFSKPLLLGFIIMCFGWGFFNGPLFWFFIYMAGTLKLDQHYKEKIKTLKAQKKHSKL